MTSQNDMNRELLISEIQTRPALWNDRHRSYKDRQMTAKLWEEVAQIVGVSVTLAKAKWKNLKDKFRIELKNVPECRSGSEAQEYKGKWPFFNLMKFTKDVVAPSITQGNLGNSALSTETSDTETDTDVTLLSPISPANSDSAITSQNTEPTCSRSSSRNIGSINTPVHPRKKRTTEQTEIETYLEIEKEKLELLKNDQHKNDDLMSNPDYHFLMSLLPYFTEFDSLEKLEVRAGLQNVIIEALRRKKQGNFDCPQQKQQGYSSVNAGYSSVLPGYSSETQASGLGNYQVPF